MILSLLDGFKYGMLLSFLIGPVFFALLETSIQKGFRAGFLLAIGVLLSDSAYIFITYFGVSQFLVNDSFKLWLGITGGGILIIFGIITFLKKVGHHNDHEKIKPGRKGVFRYIFKGFVLNGINPFVLIYWIGIVSLITMKDHNSEYHVYAFFAGIALTVFATDLIKAFFANKIRHLITEKLQMRMNKLVGTGLLVFGVRMIVLTFFGKIW